MERKLEASFEAAADTVATTAAATEERNADISPANCLIYDCFDRAVSVNFFLCSEDVECLLDPSNGLLNVLELTNSAIFVREFYDTNRSKNIARRNSALLGSDFLRWVEL